MIPRLLLSLLVCTGTTLVGNPLARAEAGNVKGERSGKKAQSFQDSEEKDSAYARKAAAPGILFA